MITEKLSSKYNKKCEHFNCQINFGNIEDKHFKID